MEWTILLRLVAGLSSVMGTTYTIGEPVRSRTVFRHRESGFDAQALDHVRVRAASDVRGWHGIHLEVGSNHGWNVDDLMVDGHLVVLNLAETSLMLRTRSETSWSSNCMPPQTFWIHPEGHPFSLKHDQDSYWASCVVDGELLDGVMGRHHELIPGVGVVDAPMAHLCQTLIDFLDEPAEESGDLADAVVGSFVRVLATRHGRPALEQPLRGGIPPAQLRPLIGWLEQNFAGAVTVDAMASKVGLSAAHFSREFKRSVGLSPWSYVVNLRLDAAAMLLRSGASVSSAASQTGFADQPHLSRLFKQRFGVSPMTYVRASRETDTTCDPP